MYRLYDYDVHSLIDESTFEGDIIDTISVFMELPTSQRFKIKIYNEENKIERDYRVIRNVRDYYNYVKDYNDRIKIMSCVELKRSIIKRKDKKC